MAAVPKKPHIVVIGGGTGSSIVLESLLPYLVELTAIVTTMDSGGSSGQLREEYPGLIGIGDIRQCMSTLADNHKYALGFEKRTIDGHAAGNLQLLKTALELGGVEYIEQAIELLSKKFELRGHVIPVSLTCSDLLLLFPSGKKISGEINVATYRGSIKDKRGTLRLEPATKLNPRAKDALNKANLIVIAPGNFYGSIIPPLLVDNICDMLVQSQARLVMVGNVGETVSTQDFNDSDYLSELQRHTSLKPDVLIANGVGPDRFIGSTRLISYELASTIHRSFDPRDKLAHTRTKIRHNTELLGPILMEQF